MLRIAFCDDNELQRGILSEYFGILEKDYPGTFYTEGFASGPELLEAAGKEPFQIYLLDLIMPEMNGMEVAKLLRDGKDKGKIVFLTVSKDYVFDAFSVKASDYLIKPITPEKLYERINLLKAEIEEESPRTVIIKSVVGEYSATLDSIAYIENIARSPIYHLLDGTEVEGISRREKFSTVIADYLDSGFALCNVSVAVNLSCITSFKRDSGVILLSNGQELYCSRTMTKEFKARLDKYRG